MNRYLTKNEQPQNRPFVASELTEEDVNTIRTTLLSLSGFDFGVYKDGCIKRRIAARIRSTGTGSVQEYVRFLDDSGTEAESLIQTLTIHVSHFFRNPTTFDYIDDHVLPDLFSEGSSELKTIWSVGCSTGEEPYSIALLLQKRGYAEHVEIIGSDISGPVIEEARRGNYPISRVQEIDESLLQKYFIKSEDQFGLRAPIRKNVQFMVQDIRKTVEFPCANLILCRNVLIYFSKEEQERIIGGFASVLPKGGWLILGRSETMPQGIRKSFEIVSPAERIYRKT